MVQALQTPWIWSISTLVKECTLWVACSLPQKLDLRSVTGMCDRSMLLGFSVYIQVRYLSWFLRHHAEHMSLLDIYQPKVVGMLWSMLAQEQTWFGNEPWKSYGIQVCIICFAHCDCFIFWCQLLPITVASEARDDVLWVSEMLPVFEASCASDLGGRLLHSRGPHSLSNYTETLSFICSC